MADAREEFDKLAEQSEPPLYVDRDSGGSDEMDFVDPPGWPKPIGIIDIIWGVINIGCTGCGIGMQVLFSGMMNQAFPDGVPPIMQNPPILNYVAAAIGAVVAILLIVAGAVLLGRKAIARPLHLVYGVLAVLSIVLSAYIQLQVQQEIAEWVQQNPDTAFAQQQSQGGAIGALIGVIVTLLFGIWPVFCLVWFGVIKRDASEIERGAEQLV